MSTTGLFYAFAKSILDDAYWRFLITFATRDVADSWFRAVEDSVHAGYTKYADVKRVSPQWYTHNPNVGRIDETILDPKVAAAFSGKIFFTVLANREEREKTMVILPILNYADHINGATFSVRSVTQPDTFWYYDPAKKAVFASCNNRTRFTITIAGGAKPPRTVMIGSDDVYIASTSDNVSIGIANSQTGQLGLSAHPFPFRFSAFATDFLPVTAHRNGVSAEEVIRNPGKGEKWELV
ncbi:hypothetical protein FRB94_013422 [Tulasnella sp. JGI-2019a]|nr:hypothetical protein FRB94_013422 [Tulasnella sp. JGI-2019a]KAG9036836.1 hypothetical protein FRB95_007681 [Tulasnella sp. JGI-2019a]